MFDKVGLRHGHPGNNRVAENLTIRTSDYSQ